MKFQLSAALVAMSLNGSCAFINSNNFGVAKFRSKTSLSMVLEMPKKRNETKKEKKLAKIETLKTKSGYLTQPLKEVCSMQQFVIFGALKAFMMSLLLHM